VAKTTRYLLAVHVLIPLWYLVHRKHRLLEMQASSSSCARLAPGVVAVCGWVRYLVLLVPDSIRRQSLWLGYHIWWLYLRIYEHASLVPQHEVLDLVPNLVPQI